MAKFQQLSSVYNCRVVWMVYICSCLSSTCFKSSQHCRVRGRYFSQFIWED